MNANYHNMRQRGGDMEARADKMNNRERENQHPRRHNNVNPVEESCSGAAPVDENVYRNAASNAQRPAGVQMRPKGGEMGEMTQAFCFGPSHGPDMGKRKENEAPAKVKSSHAAAARPEVPMDGAMPGVNPIIAMARQMVA